MKKSVVSQAGARKGPVKRTAKPAVHKVAQGAKDEERGVEPSPVATAVAVAEGLGAIAETLAVPQTPRRKTILVDGASFYHPSKRQPLNIGQVNWAALVRCLKEIGSGTATMPIYTIWPGTPDYTMKRMSASGLKLEPITSDGEADDRFLIDIINKLDPAEVETLVLVTYDSSFVEACRSASERGIYVWWVAADVQGRNGRPLIGEQVADVIKNDFNFVNMADGIADLIRFRPWEELDPRKVEQKKIKVSFEAEVTAVEHTEFMRVLQPVLDRFNIKVTTTS